MRIILDTERSTLSVESADSVETYPLYSREAFAVVSRLWVKTGWQQKYPYLFTWLGRPVIQLPEDLLVIQETIYQLRPDIIIETGVAHGGSLIFYATLCEVLGRGRVVGIDIEIRPANRSAIESHILSPRITLLEGSSVAAEIVAQVAAQVSGDDRILVILDSNHSKDHVRAELEAYAPFVTTGSYIIATDGVMEEVHDVPRGSTGWVVDNPKSAAADFLCDHSEFTLDDPPAPLFDESLGVPRATHWPGAYLRRR